MKPVKLEVSRAGVTLMSGRKSLTLSVKQALDIALTLVVKVDRDHPENFVRVY